MLRNFLNKVKPHFEEGGKLHAFQSVFDGMETFLFVPNTTARTGVSIHDSIDSKRIMSVVVLALLPALFFGMYNIGYQNYQAAGVDASFFEMFGYGLFVDVVGSDDTLLDFLCNLINEIQIKFSHILEMVC